MPPRRTRLTVQTLEPRETPAAGTWTLESFEPNDSHFQTAWVSWPKGNAVRAGADVGLDDSTALIVPRGSRPVRAWEQTVLPAGYGIQADLRADGAAPAQVLIAGRDLERARPSYLAASIGAGGTVQLVRVQEGKTTALAVVRAETWHRGEWVTVTLRPANEALEIYVRHSDSGKYLDPSGSWTENPTAALRTPVAGVPLDGLAGISRPSAANGRLRFDNVTLLAPELPVGDPSTFPAGWMDWTSDNQPGFRPEKGLVSTGGSRQTARAWMAPVLPSDVSAVVGLRVDTLIPAQVLVRGTNLDGDRPTYYAASIVRGTEVKLLRVVAGQKVELGTIRTAEYLSGPYLDITLTAQGERLQIRVQRRDTGRWLNSSGVWQSDPTPALSITDQAITTPGQVGIGRDAAYAGTVGFDDLRVAPATGDFTAPSVTARIRQLGRTTRPGTVRNKVRFEATARDAVAIGRVEFFVDGSLVGRSTAPPARHEFETLDVPNGRHTLTVRAWDTAGNVRETRRDFVVYNRALTSPPTIPRHHAHIRVAALAYNGNPMGASERDRLRNDIDLVVPNVRYLSAIDQAAPDTPQLIYSNISNLYLDLLTDWLEYADRNGLAREAAFYHVTEPTPYTGESPSSRPVQWFWNVARGPATTATGMTVLTSQANGSIAGGIAFGSVGEAVVIGATDRFRETNFKITRPAAGAWGGVLEYPSAVDGAGRPTRWSPMTLASDSTDGFTTSGRVVFDPPANWVPAVVPGSEARLFYVRVRTTAGGTADVPVATTVLGRDYLNVTAGRANVIPPFDSAADRDRDGYLSDTEYASRRPGFDARFVSESRLFYPYYGPTRFLTNPSGAGVRAWAVDYHRRFLAANPIADGVFVDNSGGRFPANGVSVLERTETYASDYGAVLGAVNRGIAPKWVLANTSAGGTAADRVVRQVPATIEEFALRPLTQSWGQFLELTELVRHRLSLAEPSGFLVIDTLSTGGTPTDPRTRMAALASYYLLADPEATLFMAWGGEEPASDWSRHWWDAIAFDVGRPIGAISEFATGTDPAKPALTYRVFQRSYKNALVLFKPLSSAPGKETGGTGDQSATVHQLDREYRKLSADGSLGPVTRTVSLRNGEGAILVPA